MNSIFWCFRLIVLGYFSFHFLCRNHGTGDDLFVVPDQKAMAAPSMVRTCHADEPKNAEIAAYGWPCPGYVVASISMLMANPRGRPLPVTFILFCYVLCFLVQLHLTSFSSFSHVCKGIHRRALYGNIAGYGEDNEGKH